MMHNSKSSKDTYYQLWVGTTVGSAIMLNCPCHQTTNASEGGGGPGTAQPYKTASIVPSGHTHALKGGQLLDISFLDTSANLFLASMPQARRQHRTSGDEDALAAGGGGGTTAAAGGGGADAEGDDFLNLDNFDLNYQASNSIADNFGASGNSDAGGTNSPSSPTGNTPTGGGFVNPFANTPPPPAQIPLSANSVLDETKFPSKPAKSMRAYMYIQIRNFYMHSRKFFVLKGAMTLGKLGKNDMAIANAVVNSTGQDPVEKTHYAVLTSETQIKVIILPSHTCIHQYSITDTTVAKASVTVVNCKWHSINNNSCFLICGFF